MSDPSQQAEKIDSNIDSINWVNNRANIWVNFSIFCKLSNVQHLWTVNCSNGILCCGSLVSTAEESDQEVEQIHNNIS